MNGTKYTKQFRTRLADQLLGEDAHGGQRDLLIHRELDNLELKFPALSEAVAQAKTTRTRDKLQLVLDRALATDPEAAERLWFLLTSSHAGQRDTWSGPASSSSPMIRDRLRTVAVRGLFGLSAAAVGAAYVVASTHESWRQPCLRITAFIILSSLPGGMYLRFVSVKSAPLRTDYVLSLHRLGVDRPEFLPRPPVASIYFNRWVDAGGDLFDNLPNIYMDKFHAFYGRARRPGYKGESRRTGNQEEYSAPLGALLPVALAGIVVSLGWAAILLDPSFFDERVGGIADVLRFGFLGAYAFNLQMLLRRYYQGDLRPSGYVSVVIRFIVVLIIVEVMHAAWPVTSGRTEMATAFVVGFFPMVGMQWLQKVAAAQLKRAVTTLQSKYPLADLDGLNVWYEARLLEEGIEDMQNLATANLVDVILHTRVPVGRLVDWVDQAVLLLHLEPATRDNDGDSAATVPASSRDRLRRLGIRSATDLEDALGRHHRTALTDQEDDLLRHALSNVLGSAEGCADLSVAHCLLKTFEGEPNLMLVRSWRADWSADSLVDVRTQATTAAGAPDGQAVVAAV